MRKLRTLLCCVVCSATLHTLYGQNEATMYFMNSLSQVTYLNPALAPRYKVSVGLPGSSIYFLASNNGFTYQDMAYKVRDSIVVNLNKLHNAMANKNYITNVVQADIFRLSMKVNARMFLTLNSTAKAYSRIMLPKDIVGLLAEGTIAYVGGSASLSPQYEGMTYLENAISASYVVNRKLTVGLRLKMLKGGMNISTNTSSLNLSLDQDYAITATATADVKTSGVHQLDDNDFSIDKDWKNYLKNNGFGFDVGGTYNVNDRLMVGMSLLDIGSINWKNNTYGYKLDPSVANYTFRGIDLNKVLNKEDDSFDVDSVEKKFDFKEGTIASYRTPLPGKMYVSGRYELKRNFFVGALIFAEKFRGRLSSGFSANLTKDFGRRVTTSLSYTITNRSANNLGAGLSLNFAPFQFYIVGDNILRAPLAILTKGEITPYVNSSTYFNMRVGLNFVFGWDKTQEKQPSPQR